MKTLHDNLSLVLFLFSLTCLLAPPSTARPAVEPPSGSMSAPKPPQSLQGLWTPDSHGRNTRAFYSTNRATLIEKRTPPTFSYSIIQMKMMTFTTIGYITPIASAARALEDFYSSIAIKAGGVWAANPRLEHFSIQEGNFELSFESIGDAIPWPFVKRMAEKLWESACLGMAQLFDVVYADDAGQVLVSISLRLTDGGSSSGSDTQYREGSVPSITSP